MSRRVNGDGKQWNEHIAQDRLERGEDPHLFVHII